MKAPWLLVALIAGCGPKTADTPVQEPAATPATASTAPAASAEVTMASGELVLPAPIVFETNGATLTAESDAPLGALYEYLVKHEDITLLRIEGHLAQSGEQGLMMSGERAFSVGRWLRDKGIDCKRLLAAAFGDSKPVADPSSADAATQNTRITLVPAELRGRAIGSMPIDGGAALSTNVCPE